MDELENLNFDLPPEGEGALDTSGVPQLSEEEMVEAAKKAAAEFKALSPLEQIKFVCTQKGVSAHDPKKGCKRCNGTGIERMKTVTISGDHTEEVPHACHCMFREVDYETVFGPMKYSRKLMRRAEKHHFKKAGKNSGAHARNELIQKRKKLKTKKRKARR